MDLDLLRSPRLRAIDGQSQRVPGRRAPVPEKQPVHGHAEHARDLRDGRRRDVLAKPAHDLERVPMLKPGQGVQRAPAKP